MPDRPVFDVFDTTGLHVVRMGDISGMPWGGSGFTLPADTYGLWTRREGAWLQGNVTMFYAWLGEVETALYDPAGAGNQVAPWTHEIVLNLVLPFGSIRVAQGRLITFEVVFLSSTFFYDDQVPAAQTTPGGLISRILRAQRNGAAEADFPFLAGPTSVGTDLYAGVKLRCTLHAGHASTIFNMDRNVKWSIKVLLRMFSHEVHSAPTVVGVTNTTTAVDGSKAAGPGGDVTGGTGTTAGGYTGEAGGDLLIV